LRYFHTEFEYGVRISNEGNEIYIIFIYKICVWLCKIWVFLTLCYFSHKIYNAYVPVSPSVGYVNDGSLFKDLVEL